MITRHVLAALKPLRNTIWHPQWLLNRGTDYRRLVAKHATGVVLDIGCADCWAKEYLSRENTCYIGLDHLVTGVTLYNTRPNVFADAASLPFTTGSIDTVIMFDVIEHVALPDHALQDIYRVLKPEGKLLLSMPFLYPAHDEPYDYQRLTTHGLRRDLAASGLDCEQLSASLHSSASTGLLLNLSLAGSALQAIHSKHPGLLLIPLLALIIPSVNVLFWLGIYLLPHWDAFSCGHYLMARKNPLQKSNCLGRERQEHAE